MSKKRVSTQQTNRVRTLVKEGKTTTQIQKQLQKEHLGMRRTVLLAYIRKYKGHKPKAEPYKYTPKKYRKVKPKATPETLRREKAIRRAKMKISDMNKTKHVAVYGSQHGKSKRIQISGTGRELYGLMPLLMKHPPKKQFLTTKATTLGRNPYEYLERGKEWDDRPKVKS